MKNSKSKTIKIELNFQQMELIARFANIMGMSMDDAVQYLVIRSLDDILRSRLFGTPS